MITLSEIDKKMIADFSRPDPVPKKGRIRADKVMERGEMFRYSGDPTTSEILLFEQKFAQYIGTRYALALNSCSSALLISLEICGVKREDKVLMPSFTFTAVPSAIVTIGAEVVFVECNDNYRIDLADFRHKVEMSGAKVFLLSYMRGHTSDLDAIQKICTEFGVTLIEDAAHALGNRWRGKLLGNFGRVAGFSSQSNKVINSGEGGILVTNDPEMIAKAIFRSGAYERLPEKHFLDQEATEYLKKHQDTLPLLNVRATNTMGAMLLDQIGPTLDEKAKVYRSHYEYLVAKLGVSKHLSFPQTDHRESRIPDSIQFYLMDSSMAEMKLVSEHINETKLPVAAFGANKSNARFFENWGYIEKIPNLPMTKKSLMNTCDMRLPYLLTNAHLDLAARIILEAIDSVKK